MEDAVFSFALTLHTHTDFATYKMHLKTNYTKSYMVGFCKFSRREWQRKK